MNANTLTSESGWHSVRSSVDRVRLNPLVREFTALAGSTAVLQAGNFVLTLLLARTLGPAAYGAWTAMAIFTSYLGYLQLGVVNAMHRELPSSLGAELPERADRIQRTAWSGSLLSLIVGVVLLLGIPPRLVVGAEHTGALRLMALYLCGQQCYSYMACYLRATTRFYLLSRQQVLLAVGLLCVTLPLALWGGLRGAVIGQAAVYLGVALSGLLSVDAGLLRWRGLVWKEWLALVRIGLPIMVVGVGHYALITFDRLVALYCGGTEFMGQYAFQARILALSPLVANVVADQLYPRAAAAYGRVPTPSTLIPFFRQQVITISGLTLTATLGLYFGVPILVRSFLPAYSAGLRVMPVLLVGSVLLSLCSACGGILTVLNLQGRYLLAQALLIPAGIGMALGFSRAGLGGLGLAWATTITYALYLFVLSFFIRSALWPRGGSSARSLTSSCAN